MPDFPNSSMEVETNTRVSNSEEVENGDSELDLLKAKI